MSGRASVTCPVGRPCGCSGPPWRWGSWAARSRPSPAGGRPGTDASPLVLVAGLALATPVCMLGYSLFGADIYTPRHLLASLPAVALLLGLLFTTLPRR